MEIRTEMRGDAMIALAPNRIDSANALEFQKALQVAVDQHDCAMVLDMEDLTYISSAGFRAMVLITRALRRKNVDLVL